MNNISFIVAVDKNYAIGKDNDLLAYLPEDLKYFKEKTLDKTVIMGRKTLESLPGGKPLPKRRNIVISKTLTDGKGAEIVSDIETALEISKEDEVMVMGGESIYEAMMQYCNTAYITRIDKEFDADKFLKGFDEFKEWKLVSESKVQTYEGINYRYCIYERI